MAEAFIGQIGVFGFTYAPVYWAQCDGSQLPLIQYQALYTIIGTAFGGDGHTIFGLPDLRGTAMSGSGEGAYSAVYGQKVGVVANTIGLSNLPAHSHTVNGVATAGDIEKPTPAGNMPAQGRYNAGLPPVQGRWIYGQPTQPVAMGAPMVGYAGGGASTPVDNRQPWQATTFCICLEGNYPMRPS